MHWKWKTIEYWVILSFFLMMGLDEALIVTSKPIPPINYIILAFQIIAMAELARWEDILFPEEKPKID